MDDADRDNIYKCELCSLKLENYLIYCQHLHQIHNVEFLQCDYCSSRFPSNSELQRHIISKHTDGQNPRVECSRCPSTFMTIKGLENHMTSKHSSENLTFPCQECDNTYKTYATLRNHLKTAHLPLTYVKCDECPKIFYKKNNLKRHKEVEHSLDFKRAQCSLCPLSFKYRECMSRHMQEKHFCKERNHDDTYAETDNKCNICSQHFIDKVTLLEHRKTLHNRHIDIFSCNECSAVFKIREAYEHHLQEEHGICIQTLAVENKDYVFQDYVDFERTMEQNFELRQLMKIRKSFNFSQKLAIISYNQEQSDDEDLSIIDESELNTILQNINSFFQSLVNQYRGNKNTLEVSSTQNDSYNDLEEQKHSEMKYLDFNSMEPQENSNKENNVLKQLDVEYLIDTFHISKLDTLTSDITQKSIQEDALSAIQMPKIMFNCLECAELFSDETLLWNHLTSVHKKTNKKPLSLETSETVAKSHDGEIAAKVIANKSNLLKTDDKGTKQNLKAVKVSQHPNALLEISRKPSRTIRTGDEKKILEIKKVSTKKTGKQNVVKQFKYICMKCGDSFRRNTQLRVHRKLKHSVLHNCNICDKSFKLKVLLAQHLKFSHGEGKKVEIDKARVNNDNKKLSSANKYNINNIFEQNTPGREYSTVDSAITLAYDCPKCGGKYETFEQLKNHNNLKHSAIHKCDECDKSFKRKAVLTHHIKYHNQLKKIKPKGSKKTSSIAEEQKQTSETTVKETDVGDFSLMFPCDHCEALFPCIELLLNHCSWQHKK